MIPDHNIAPFKQMHNLDLNGTWQFTLDPENKGLSEAWYQSPGSPIRNSRPIQVPSCWEEYEQDYEGVAWYAKEIEVDASLKGQVCRICFEASNYRTGVWINGKAVGSHEGGYTPFDFQIQAFLKYDSTNRIVVRVVGPIVTRDLTVDGLGPNDMPHWRGGLTAGIWQSVRLEFNRDFWLKQPFYRSSLKDSGFLLKAEIQSKAIQPVDATLALRLTDADGQTAFESGEPINLLPGTNHSEILIRLAEPKLWDGDNPHLYTAELSVEVGGQIIAGQTDRIGLKEFIFKEGRFYLNGEPCYLQGGFWEGVYAKHQSYPENRDVIRKEIEMAKAAGLNLLRPWRRPVPPIILEEADAMGMLIIASPAVECMSCWPTATPEAPSRIKNEIRSLVLRDRNHPSIIWWEMFNEVTRIEFSRLIPEMALMTRELDPTRLVLDESGGWAGGSHFYPPHSRERHRLCELHSYVRAPLDRKHRELYQNLGNKDTIEGNTEIKAGTPIFMSEFGFGGWPEIETNYRLFQEHGNPLLPSYRQHAKLTEDLKEALKVCELQNIFADVDSICRATQEVQARGNRHQLEALLANPVVSGYCIHAFTDGDWILGAGLIDHWQRPKSAYHAIAEANRNPRLLCFVSERNLSEVKDVDLRIVYRDSNGTLPERTELVSGKNSHEVPPGEWTNKSGFPERRLVIPAQLLSAGKNSIEVNTYLKNGKLARSAIVELFIPEAIPEEPTLPVVIYDPTGDLAIWQKQQLFEIKTLETWSFTGQRCVYVFGSEDVSKKEDLHLVRSALEEIDAGTATGIFLEPPSSHELTSMIREYDGCPVAEPADNQLLQSGIFPFALTARPTFSFWEGTAHVVKEHPIFNGLPTNCLMDEPYQEVAPVESFYELEALEAPAQTITWFRTEFISTKTKKRTYLGGDDLWHGTNLAVKAHGKGKILLSTLILRSKASTDPVASCILSNMINYACTINAYEANAVHVATDRTVLNT